MHPEISAQQIVEKRYELSIRVISVRGIKNREGIEYVGRSCAGWRGSVLANRFVIGKDGSRPEVIRKYKAWLQTELKSQQGPAYEEALRLADRVRRGDRVVLGCWCKPLACHADVLQAAVVWLVSRS